MSRTLAANSNGLPFPSHEPGRFQLSTFDQRTNERFVASNGASNRAIAGSLQKAVNLLGRIASRDSVREERMIEAVHSTLHAMDIGVREKGPLGDHSLAPIPKFDCFRR